MMLLYYPEIDYLCVANWCGTIFYDRRIIKKYGISAIRNMDFYVIDSDLK